jgi:hypothetical protein
VFSPPSLSPQLKAPGTFGASFLPDRQRGEPAMNPIDYFMSIFVGMCIGLAGLSFVFQ